MNTKNLIITALLCLIGGVNAWAYKAELNKDSNKNFTTDPAESAVTFEISNLGDWANEDNGWLSSSKHCAGYQVGKKTMSEISWSVSSDYTLTVNSVTVGGKVAGNKAFDVYTSKKNQVKSSDNKNENTIYTIELTKSEGYFSDNSNSEIIYIKHGDAILYINYITISYTLANLQSGEITIHENTINADWNAEYDVFGATNIVEYNTGADQSEISIVSNNETVAHYDASTKKIITGTTTGTAIFTVSGNATATHSKPTDQTFTVNVDAIAYNYALQFLTANGDADAANTLANTHNKSDVDAVLALFRANKIANVANGDDITYMMENGNFEYSSDRLYGWTNNGYEVIEKNGIQVLHKERGGVASIDEASVQQTVQLPIGYYQMSVDMYSEYLDNIYMSFGGVEKKAPSRGTNAGMTARYCVSQDAGENVVIKVGNLSEYDTYKKVSEFSNFSLTYICSKATYDAYMDQYSRAEGIKDNTYLQTATSNALNNSIVDINTLADAAAIEARTTALKNACDKAEAEIAWCAENNPAQVNINNVLVYAGVNKELGRGANWGTRAVVAEDGLTVNVTTAANGIANLTFTDNKKLFETTDHYIYTDYKDQGNYDFYLVGDDENGYKIVLAGDRTKALGIIENMEWETEKFADVVMPVDVAEATVWYFAADKSKLNIKANRYGTFCAPYEVTLPNNVIAYSAAIDGTAVILTELQDKNVVPANTPVIVKNDNNEEVTAYYYGETASSATVTVGPLVGTLETMTVPVGAYVMQNQNGKQNFFIVAEGLQPTINKNKAYIVTENNARVLTFGVNDETAIEAIEALVENKAEIYDLNGRRLSGLQKGINIVNGKKVLVK